MVLYDILWQNQSVGTACVETVGLYTKFQCRCSFSNEGMYRVFAQYGSVKADLGICVPEESEYVTCAKIPTKNLNNEIPQFYVSDGVDENMFFVPVRADEKFCNLDRLFEARFCVQEGEKGLLIKNTYFV